MEGLFGETCLTTVIIFHGLKESRVMFQGMIYFSADVDGVTSGNMSNGSVTIMGEQVDGQLTDRGTPGRCEEQ